MTEKRDYQGGNREGIVNIRPNGSMNSRDTRTGDRAEETAG